LRDYFAKHGEFAIVHVEFASDYPQCPLFEPRRGKKRR
jgi:hypothetical protein